ncbi:YihY/virulence factor BrkB family protein [Chlorogloea sp. CCALA 695]|uniref:YihY/virulence factor BrkB family protein n=1 Tax=Chlorogloea sp. CCALA 695 TaxID=2107693 RepID=UPI000D079BFE|nr:YihY/virulence factor BrkB family protein [Chlorogloea sp. CCALA 695]PSB27340.1 YihY/virulence factor BrkB family protein [Chlorogloea sp. CCALA 695]
MKLKTIFTLLKETVDEWNKDKASRLAAALAYYTVFSLSPLLIIAIAIAGAIFGEEAARGEIVGQIQGLVGKDGAEFIQTAIESAAKPTEGGGFASAISVVVLLFGASGVFSQLQDALNTIWEVQPDPKAGAGGFIRARFLAFSMVLGIGFLLLVSLLLSAGLSGVIGYLGHLFPVLASLLQVANFVLGFIVTTVLFGLIYKFLPDVKITWSDVLIGAAMTSLLFSIGRYGLGLYLGNSSFGSTYGAAGSLVIILAWVYYAAQILFFGAEFTQVYARRYGSQIVPDKNAIPIAGSDRAQQGMKPNTTSRPAKSKSASPNFVKNLVRRFTKRKSKNRRP